MVKVTRGVDQEAVPATPVAALGFSYSIQIDDRNSLVLQSHLPLDCPPSAIDAALDKMANAVARQGAKFTIIALKRSLKMQTKQLRRVTEDLALQDEASQLAFKVAGKKGSYQLNQQQEIARRNVLVTQLRFKEEILDIEEEIAAAEKLANGSDGSPTG